MHRTRESLAKNWRTLIFACLATVILALSGLVNSGSEAAEPNRLIPGGVLKPEPPSVPGRPEPRALVPGGALRPYSPPSNDRVPAALPRADTPRARPRQAPAPHRSRQASPPPANQAPMISPQEDGQVRF